MKFLALFLVTIFTLMGCENKNRETELLEQINVLKKQLDDCENGAEKIHAKFKLAYENNDFLLCKQLYAEMEKRHIDSNLFLEVKEGHDKIIKVENEKAKKEKLLAEAHEKELKQKAEKDRQEKLITLKKLKKKYDDVDGITWYENPYFTHYNNKNLTSIYIGHQGNSLWLRLKMSYQGDDWIFFDQAYLSYDGNTKQLFFNEYEDKKTENSGGGVWEWIDVQVTADTEAFLRDFAKSKNAKMRLSGKYTRTRNLSLDERRGIIDILNGYDALQKGFQ